MNLPSPEEVPVGDLLTDFSPSRAGTMGKCGRAFEYSYIRKLPRPYDRGATLFGDVFHMGVEEWYGVGYKDHRLAPIVCAQWPKVLPEAIWNRVVELRDLDEECKAVAAAIHFNRPELKSPSSTKAYLGSDAVKAFSERKVAMLELCDALPDLKWPKDEDPYKAYVKCAEIADQAEKRWKDQPPPLYVEVAFQIELFGFRMRGRIDRVQQWVVPGSGVVVPVVLDYKTGRQPLTQMEAFLQMYLYHEGAKQVLDMDIPDIAFYLARHDIYQQGRIDPKRHARIASRILHERARQIATHQFEPSYGYWCKQCDFNDVCAGEISIWKPGDDNGRTQELILT